MKLKCFSVHDAAAEAYLPPFYARSTGEAMRSFVEAANDEKGKFFAHAADYTLFEIGEFDDLTGIIHPLNVHRPLGKAIDFKRTE